MPRAVRRPARNGRSRNLTGTTGNSQKTATLPTVRPNKHPSAQTTVRFDASSELLIVVASFPHMAVFTPVSLDDLSGWISQFSLGKALAIEGISSGIENSNFFITTDSGEYVLTLFEKLGCEQLPFYLELMRHLAQRYVPVPAPVPNGNGSILHVLNGKPATIVTRL